MNDYVVVIIFIDLINNWFFIYRVSGWDGLNFFFVDKLVLISLFLDFLLIGLIVKNERNLKLIVCKCVRYCDYLIDCKVLDIKLR